MSEILEEVSGILDNSITAGQFVIPSTARQLVDLSTLDFEALKTKFATGFKHTEAEKLKGVVKAKLQQMVVQNRSRLDYVAKFQSLIEEYNTSSRNVDWFFKELIAFTQELKGEDKRAIAQNLSEEELAIFDLLTKPNIELSKEEELAVKQVARVLLQTLKTEKLVLDWRKRQDTKASVEVAIKDILDKLPESYSADLYNQKCGEVFQHIYNLTRDKVEVSMTK